METRTAVVGIAAWAGAVLLSAFGGTYWVDVNSSVTPQTGTEDAPYTRIQDAVDAAQSGDTIYVKPGVYGANQGVATEAANSTQSRVLVNGKKNLSILATGSAADTSIVGYRSAETTASDNICCVTLLKANGSVLRGFTLTGGGGRNTNGANSYSGGVNDPNGSYGSDATTFVVDCVITNCLGTRGGGARGVNLVRCRLEANKALNPNGNIGGQAASRVNAYFCLFANHQGFGSYTVDYPTKLVNCTFLYNNQGQSAQFVKEAPSNNLVANCVFASVSGYGDGATRATASNCAVGLATIAACNFADGGGNVCSKGGNYLCTQSAFGVMDAHLVSSSGVVGKGSRDALDLIPEAYRDKDLDGTAIGASDALNIGCYQTVTTDYGCLHFDSLSWEVEGYGTSASATFIHPAAPFEQFRVKPNVAAGKTLFSIFAANEGSLNDSYYIFPDPEGWYYVMPKKKAGCRTKISTVTAKNVYYAAPDGDDANDGLTAATPKTLQGAVDARANAGDATVVFAAAGEYATGTTLSCEHHTRLAIPEYVAVRGAGIGKTVIRGRKDPNWETEEPNYYGRGTNAVRCATMTGWCCLQGVTLADGYTSVRDHQDEKGYAGTNGGGVYGSSMTGCQLLDCEVADCCASRAASFTAVKAVRCRVHGCRETNNSNAQNATLVNCYLYGNITVLGVIGTGCKAYGCTVDIGKSNKVSSGDGKFRNCVFLNGDANQATQAGGTTNCLLDVTCFNASWNPTCRKTDALFADKANADYRLTSFSPAIGFGVAEDDLDRFSEGTMELARMPLVNGRPTCGAWQIPVQAYFVADVQGVSVTGGTAGATNVLAAGESVTVTATGEGRLIDHFCVDGVDLDASVRTYTLTAPAEGVPAAGGSVVGVIVPHLYADATGGDETNDGLTAATPKRLLASVLGKAIAGDTVHLAAGRYAEGSMVQSERTSENTAMPEGGYTVRARGVVPAKVTLVGDEGAEATFVCGEASTDETADTKGLGPGAMRCLWLGKGSTAKGITFTDGHTAHPGTGGQPDNDDQRGSGVLGYECASCTVEDCVISNCVSKRSSAARNVTYVRCRVLDNWAAWNSVAGGNVRAFDTYIDGNIGENTIQPSKEIVNCTYGPRNRNGEHLTYVPGSWTVPFVFDSSKGTNLLNSVVAGTIVMESFRAANCVMQNSGGYRTFAPSNLVDCVAVDNLDTQWATWIGEDGTVIDRSFAGVDLGNAAARAKYAQAGETDLAGAARVANGAIDAGAREYDWKADYAAFLGRHLTVTAADPMVRLADGCITLPHGTALTALVARNADCSIDAAFGVTGDDAALSVTQNGTLVGTYGKGDYEIALAHAADTPSEITFACAGSDDASAALRKLKAAVGTMLILR